MDFGFETVHSIIIIIIIIIIISLNSALFIYSVIINSFLLGLDLTTSRSWWGQPKERCVKCYDQTHGAGHYVQV